MYSGHNGGAGGGAPCFRIGGVEDNFFLFLRSLLWELWTPNLLFHSSNVGLKILKKWFMPQVYINGTFKFDQKRNCPPSNGLNFFGRFLLSTLPLFLPPKHSGVGGWVGGVDGRGSFDINTLFHTLPRKKLTPTIHWVSSLNLYGVVHILCNRG